MNYITIKQFLGLNLSQDVLNVLPGQLSINNNYLYMSNGGLQERGGGDELSSDPVGGDNKVYGFDNYLSNTNQNYLITVQGTKVYGYYTAAWHDLGVTVTTSLKTRFEQAGFDATRALYGVNGVDGVIKIIGDTPTASIVAATPTTMTGLKLHKNRLFGWAQDTLYFTDALAFDTWQVGTNDIQVAPGIDGYIQSCEVWGDALFIFKETGVYVLPNAADADPATNWNILRCDAETGTQSPDTVKKTRLGIMFLGSDDKIRLIGPNISFSSGEYTLGGTGSPSICEAIFDYINTYLDRTTKQNAVSIVYKDLYVISFQSTNNSGTYNDTTFFADTTKIVKLPNNPQPEPFWGQFTGFDYDYYTQQTSSGEILLYGAKGTNGHIQNTLNDAIHNDNSGAIESYAVLGWYPIGGDGTKIRINKIKFTGFTEQWNINLTFNAYTLGKELPEDGEGIQKIFTTNTPVGSLVDTGLVDTAIVGTLGIASTVYHVGLRGNYFKAEFKNINADEFTRIISMLVYYRAINQK